MDEIELRKRLGAILREEEREQVDWEEVARMCREMPLSLGSDCPHVIYHYLCDSDIRERDEVFGRSQRAEVRRFVQTGERSDIRRNSPWGYVAVIAIAGAALFVMLY